MPGDLSQTVAKIEAALLPQEVASTAHPVLIMMSGLPGSGKSYLSKRLADQLPAVIIEADRVRKTLFPRPTYDAQESALVHRTCQEVMRHLLRKGMCVVFDATNLVEFQREILYSLADRCDAGLLIVRTVAPEQTIRDRLERRREAAEGASDADWRVYRRMSRRQQKISRTHLCVDTSDDIDEAVRKVMRAVRRCSRP